MTIRKDTYKSTENGETLAVDKSTVSEKKVLLNKSCPTIVNYMSEVEDIGKPATKVYLHISD